MNETLADHDIDELKRLYNSNLDVLENLKNTGFDHRTKTGIRAYIDKSNRIIKGLISWKYNHQYY